MGFLFPLLLAYTNGTRAARKGHNVWLWAFLSFVAYLLASTAGGMLLVACFYKGDLLDRQAMMEFFEEGLLRSITLLMEGVGGFLAVRYAIDRLKPRNQGGGQQGSGEPF